MSPKSLPLSSSVYIVTVPLRMVEVLPLAASTCPVLPPGPSTSWCRSRMSTERAVNFRAFLTVPLWVRTLTMPW
jgi:hypothetical protein